MNNNQNQVAIQQNTELNKKNKFSELLSDIKNRIESLDPKDILKVLEMCGSAIVAIIIFKALKMGKNVHLSYGSLSLNINNK